MRTRTLILTAGLLLLLAAPPMAAAAPAADGYGCDVDTAVAGFHCFDGGSHQYCVVKWKVGGLQDVCPS